MLRGPRRTAARLLLVPFALVALVLLAPVAGAQTPNLWVGPLGLLVIQQTQLTVPDGAANDNYGFKVAIDGTTALVSAINADGTAGAVYAYTRDAAGAWTQGQKLKAGDAAAGDLFGMGLALQGDTAVIGASGRTIGANAAQGAVYVFTRSAGTWTQQAELTNPAGSSSEQFGWAVDVDGDTLAVAAPGEAVFGNPGQGALHVYTRSGSIWTQQTRLTAADGNGNDYLGSSVALSGDTVVAGVPGSNVGVNDSQGAAYVFKRTDGSWALQAKLVAGDGVAGDGLGSSLAFEGSTALVRSQATVAGHLHQGAVYVFTRSGSVWSPQVRLTPGDGAAEDQFGTSVALDSGTALIGTGSKTIDGNAYQGAAYVYTGSGATWTLQQRLTAADGAAGSFFGNAAALDYPTAVVGAFGKTVNGNSFQGSAYLFGLVGKPVLSKLSPTSGRRGITVTLTGKEFGATRGKSVVKFGATKVTKYVSWSAAKVKVKVPAKARFGKLKVTVTTAGGTSAARTFTVKP
jgi:hypothetical protein